MVNSVAHDSLWHSLVEDGKVIDGPLDKLHVPCSVRAIRLNVSYR